MRLLRRRPWLSSRDFELEFPNLIQVLGCYLYQYWDSDFATSRDALLAAKERQPSEQIEGAVLEIDDLLSRNLDDDTLSEILVALAGGGGPNTPQASEWLVEARQILSSERAE